jgi:hypothetical protein
MGWMGRELDAGLLQPAPVRAHGRLEIRGPEYRSSRLVITFTSRDE